jgi:hypothetical protein
MIAKGFYAPARAKVFAIMKHPAAHHDHEGFTTAGRSESFAIMNNPTRTPDSQAPRPGTAGQQPLRVTAAPRG